MKKIILTLFILLSTLITVDAKATKKDFSSVITDSGVDIESIAVSIKNTDNGRIVYSLNDKMLMNPASVQKILTTPVSYEALGKDRISR